MANCFKGLRRPAAFFVRRLLTCANPELNVRESPFGVILVAGVLPPSVAFFMCASVR